MDNRLKITAVEPPHAIPGGEITLRVESPRILLETIVVTSRSNCGPIDPKEQILSAVWDEIAKALRARVEEMDHIAEIIDYVVGPSMGAHLGPGNAGAVFIARPL